jgi:NADPH:quinone reductase-like Zn-dependent oxidoreductase
MRAAVHTRYGPPEVVQVREVPTPIPGDGDLLVRVHSTTVNRTDCHYRSATPFVMRGISGLTKPKATILGNEYAGVVEAVGTDVRMFGVGDRVFGYCEGPFGAHAEYLTVAEGSSIAAIPGHLTYTQVAPGTEGSHYALNHLRRGGVERGMDVLVYGATGAIGSAAVQLVKAIGGTVTAVCGPDHLSLVKGLGADRAVDYTVGDFTTDAQRYDVVFDAHGTPSYFKCRRLLKPGGRFMSAGPGPHYVNAVLPLLGPLLGDKRVVFSVPKIDGAMVTYLGELLGDYRFVPLLDRTYPLDDIVDAYRYAESGEKIGNVVIEVVPTS